jgi:hypothetical protein
MTLQHEPLCTYCTLGMDPDRYIVVGGGQDDD